MTFTSIQITGGNPGALLADIGEVCTLVNTSASNILTISDNESARPGDTPVVPFGPGQVMSVDGSTKIYGTTSLGKGLSVLKFPGVVQFGGSSPQTPSVTTPSIATGVANGSNTVDLIGGSGNPNPNNLAIQLLSAAICPVLFGAAPAAQNWQDQIQDSTGFPYLTAQVGLPTSGGVCAPPIGLDMKNSLVPAGRRLQLSSGGVGTGAVHVVSATVLYYLVASQ